ncbi:helix-turn-helix domain-containing protein [Pseudonocardia nematodicida]|uniref:Helix-turn-helix domain-containing protein n=1 Tax=Pseudonocardia nematodicida TaxID=1206997 RepID=A0ABV1K3V1_9PSEU
MTQRTGERADRRRNRERLLVAAVEVVARDGAGASLEEIARRAGVGSATLHRHFGSRRELLEAVFADGVDLLCLRATELARSEPAAGLWVWLDELVRYIACTRGVSDTLLAEFPDDDLTCHSRRVHDAAAPLAAAALAAGTLDRAAGTADLLTLAGAIGAATDGDPDAAQRLLHLAQRGLCPNTAPLHASGPRSAPAATGAKVGRGV